LLLAAMGHRDDRRYDDPLLSTFARSSQYVMSISRYIVVAVVRCWWACSRAPVP
jgi:hypothetical protein